MLEVSMENQTQKVIFERNTYYEGVTRLIRWLAIATVFLTYPLTTGQNGLMVFLLLCLTIIYNLSRQSGLFRKMPIFSSKIYMLVMDHIFVILLVALTGGISSPYYFFFGFTITTAAYWYGLAGLASVATLQTIVTVGVFPLITIGPQPTDLPRTILIKIVILIIIGLLTERFTHAEHQERFKAIASNQAIDNERQRLLALLNSLADAAIAVNSIGVINLYNGAALDLINTNDTLEGKNLTDVLPLIDQSDTTMDIMQVAAKTLGNQKRNDLIFLTPEGTKLNLDISIAPIYNNQGRKQNESGYVMILRDITKEKTLEQQRDEFISVASHELRTPLAIAEANISTAMLPSFGTINPKAKQLLDQAHQNIIFLGELIKDLTTLSKIEQGDLAVDLKLVEPRELLERLARDYRAEIEGKKLQLIMEIDRKCAPILTSEYRVHEILQNLITNAIKYTPKGNITVKAQPSPDGKSSILFSVKDSGIGISAADKKHIFSKFFRSEDYRTRQTGGTGLGLYITRKLAERLNGKVWFESKLNQGTTFFLEVPPFEPASKEEARAN
jgi:two-component system, OmpR family, phosphate regulon sensor histidine kinase PhoR